MKINICNISEELKENTLKIFNMLNIEMGNDGYLLNAFLSDKFSVSFKNNEFTIEYPHINLFFRGLLLIKRYKDKNFYIRENPLHELGVMMDCSRNAVRTVA